MNRLRRTGCLGTTKWRGQLKPTSTDFTEGAHARRQDTDLRKSLEQGLEAKVIYSLEVQAPGHFDDPPVLTLESDKPPMPVSVGDLINLRGYSGAHRAAKSTLVEVCKVEHVFGDSQGRADRWTRHRIVVFTESAPDEGATRVTGYPD